jgi:trans-2,3-dihydro-3-hydroxyanthranilate isomerase
LSGEVMTTFSARTRLAETSFIQRTTAADATYRHRIFVPGKEVPFAGHPSLGTAAAHAWRLGHSSGVFVQETQSGLQSIAFDLGARTGRATILQNPADFGAAMDRAAVMALVGLPELSAHPTLVPQWVNTGMPTLVIPVLSDRDLGQVRFDWASIGPLCEAWGQVPAYNFYVCAKLEAGHWGARCFGEDPRTGEDPATGSAAGPLGAYLRRHAGVARVTIEQGREMGSRSRLLVDTSDGVRVSGGVRLVGTGTLELPAAPGQARSSSPGSAWISAS